MSNSKPQEGAHNNGAAARQLADAKLRSRHPAGNSHTITEPPTKQRQAAIAVINADHHYQWLDVLRLIAAFVVVCTHTRGAVFLDWSALEAGSRNLPVAIFFSITRLGEEAVILFFVLSGFLVGGRTFEKITLGIFDEKSYLVDRFTRIWIPLIPALILSAGLAEYSDTTAVWIGNLLGVQGAFVPALGGNAPLWSLTYEIWFYVLAYAIGRQSSRSEFDGLSAVLLVFALIVFARLKFHYVFCWALGAYFYIKPLKYGIWKSLVIAGSFCLVGLAGSQARGPLESALADFRGAKDIFDIVLALGGAMLCSILVKIPPVRHLRYLGYLAGFSYTLYLIHAPVLLYVARNYLIRRPVVDIEGLAVFVGLILLFSFSAWLLYLVFERNTKNVRTWMKLKVG